MSNDQPPVESANGDNGEDEPHDAAHDKQTAADDNDAVPEGNKKTTDTGPTMVNKPNAASPSAEYPPTEHSKSIEARLRVLGQDLLAARQRRELVAVNSVIALLGLLVIGSEIASLATGLVQQHEVTVAILFAVSTAAAIGAMLLGLARVASAAVKTDYVGPWCRTLVAVAAVLGVTGSFLAAWPAEARGSTRRTYGRLVLPSQTIMVRHGNVAVLFGCMSTLPCSGRFSITTDLRLTKPVVVATIDCTQSRATFFHLSPGMRAKVEAAVTSACADLLRQARGHRIAAKLTSRPRTGQFGVIEHVFLASAS